MSDRATNLTDQEGTLLALVLRAQPITVYEISKVYEASPVSNFNTSKGKLYPMVRRLKGLGLIESRAVEGDGRGTEKLHCTRLGKKAVKAWLGQIRPAHLLLDDPLRTRIQSFTLLSASEQRIWLENIREQLVAKLSELEAYENQVDVPFHTIVHDNAVSSLEARLAWVDRSLKAIGNAQKKRAGAK